MASHSIAVKSHCRSYDMLCYATLGALRDLAHAARPAGAPLHVAAAAPPRGERDRHRRRLTGPTRCHFTRVQPAFAYYSKTKDSTRSRRGTVLSSSKAHVTSTSHAHTVVNTEGSHEAEEAPLRSGELLLARHLAQQSVPGHCSQLTARKARRVHGRRLLRREVRARQEEEGHLRRREVHAREMRARQRVGRRRLLIA